jgi:octaprenyl-diphosphate synthase
MADGLSRTPLAPVFAQSRNVLGAGKMLRARLTLRVGEAAGTDGRTLVNAAAAVEMIHAASLLHDDVIDSGYLRRGAPTFWVERGVPGAILLGDLLLFKALDLVEAVEGGRLMPVLIRLAGEVCQAESEQELVLRGQAADWDTCLRIARQKTGALFALAAVAAAGREPAQGEALLEAGYEVGTAYQLADDILDANGDAGDAGKTLGTDRTRNKLSAAGARPPGLDPADFAEGLCESAARRLAPWPAIRGAWDAYLDADFRPALHKLLRCPSST